MVKESYRIRTEAFEGPLDLLLHLVSKYEIDLHDIPVSAVTDQYMDYVHAMQQLELNVASEYLVMAATLLAIKSQLLLPPRTLEDETELYEEDPREELVHQLVEYKKFKEAATWLREKESGACQIFSRPPAELEEAEGKAGPKPEAASVFDMVEALTRMMERKKWSNPLETKVKRAEVPIQVRMEEVLNQVNQKQTGVSFSALFVYPSRSHLVVTFMAVLELMKSKEIYGVQETHFDELMLYTKKKTTGE